MKNFTMALFLAFVAVVTNSAQIPNSGFENWTTVGSYEDPVGWASMNIACAGPFYSCTKSTDHYPSAVGSYSVRVENNTSLTQFTGAYGMLVTNAMDYPFQPAFPIVGHPNSLTGYYKYDSQNNDTMFIKVVYFDNGVNVGNDDFVTGISAATWTSFSLPLNYVTADSATIMISAFYPSGPIDGPNGNSVLYVDNLNFDNLITFISEVSNDVQVKLFPNPATDIVQVDLNNVNMEELTISVYNTLGEKVRCEQMQQNQQLINIEGLHNGLYIVEVRSMNWSKRQQLIIRR